ncbi:MAG TPA: OmpA family protein [Thermoanaerobaculia bacterium]|nr:OmpA family protein [Thermoanaerobaculia bacterium]
MRQTLLLDGPLKAPPRPASSSLVGSSRPAHPILELQRTIGNRSVQQLFRKCACGGECPKCRQEEAETDGEAAAKPATLQRAALRRQPLGGAGSGASSLSDRLTGSELLDGFALNDATLTAEHKGRLAILAQTLLHLLREHPGGSVRITGHTDATGPEELNEELGQKRADAVRDFLLEAGVPAPALASVSAGESKLRVKTSRPESRNRRAEVRFEPTPTGRSFPSATLTPPSLSGPATGSGAPAPPPLAPEGLCKANPALSFCQPIPVAEPAVPRGAAFPAACTSTNCSAVGHHFDEQPPDLQKVLTASFKAPALWFQQLDTESRMALSGIFNRMCSFGVWCHVSQVLKIDPGEALVGDLLSVPGATPSVHFLNPGGNTLLDALMATGRFCQATGAGASQHPGQSTLREISGSDSLHISIGPGNQVDAHIDRNSPVTQHPGSSFCSNAPSADAVGHIGKELAPEKVRKGFSLFGRHIPGPAGFQVFPDDPAPALTAVPQPDTGSPRLTPGGSLVGITVRGPVSKPPGQPRLDLPSPVLPAEVVARIDRAIQEQFSADALLPSHARQRLTTTRKAEEFAGPDEEAASLLARNAAEQEAANYPDPYSLARELAERLEQASRNHEVFVKIDLPQYDGRDFGSRRAIAKQIERMALILRHHLPSHAEGVHSVVMFFGGATAATREEAKLP